MVNYGTANISDCTFSGNIATTRGGAIWSNNSLTVSNCTFNSNEALAVGGDARNEGNGGAIHLAEVASSIATLTDVTTTNNKSKEAGGIYVSANATLNLGGTSTISGNSSTEHGGGGIVNQGTVIVSGAVSITGNTSNGNGGGIWSEGTLNMKGTVTVQNNARVSGLASNVHLKSGKVITVTGSLGNSLIGISVEGNNATVTSSLGSNGTLSNFTNDRAAIANLSLDNGNAKITPKSSGIYYVERGWDDVNKKVTETLKVRAIDDNITELDNIEHDEYYHGPVYTIDRSGWFFISGNKKNLRYYSISVMEGVEAHLILSDGGYLHIDRAILLHNNATLSIYGQLEDTGTIENDPGTYGIGRHGAYDEANTLNIHGGTVIRST